MVKISHKKRFPALRKYFDTMFDRPFPISFPSTLHPWYRNDPWEDLERELEELEVFPSNTWFPESRSVKGITCDLSDKGDKFVLTADVPGMEKDEVSVNVFNGTIEISAEHKESEEEKKKDYIRKERSEVKYFRSLSIPEKIVGEKVAARMNNGILTVELPKQTPTKVEKPIAVKVQ
jgi:HSP20 family protein